MSEYPVHFTVEHPARFSRLQLAIRVVALLALGALGVSLGGLLLVAYLALPVFAAVRLSARRDPTSYVSEDGPRVLAVIRWFAAVCAWAGLVTEKVPVVSPDESIKLRVDGPARPTASSALLRLLTGVPSALLLALLAWVGAFVWLWAAFSVLLHERVGQRAFQYLLGLQRWSARLLVYQASLVDEYPPFSFVDTPPLLTGPDARPV